LRPIALLSPMLFFAFVADAAAADADRYRLERTDNGFVRMDTRTGEMSVCEERWNELVCRLAADERTAVQAEIERLQTQMKALEARTAAVKALEDRVAALENSLAAKLEQSLPTEEDFNRTMGYMEKFFRSFMGIVKEFEDDKTQAPGADRT
jgi:tetrahydromethanopterin S-methyltransferase subunit B